MIQSQRKDPQGHAKKARLGWLAASLLAAIGFGLPAAAHHPVLGKFNGSAQMTLQGVVTYVDWRNPHAHVFINVAGAEETQNWAIELESPVVLVANGWSADTLQPGDHILVDGITAHDGTRQIWGESVALASSGRRVYSVGNATPPRPLASRPAPRWPNGRVALGAVTGSASGFWSYPSATALVENGVSVEMNEYGLLADVDDAARVAPMQDWALALYEHRQSRQLRDDPTYLNCKPPGGPRQYQSNLGLQLIEDQDRERIFVLFGSGNSNYRIIYLDGREAVGQVTGDDDNPLYYGRSNGVWEGDTLVVDTRSFNEDFWFTQGGLPHTSQLSMIERFTRSDNDTLEYSVTIDDPGAYTRSWTASWTLRWLGGQEMPIHLCQNNRP
jgi:hypothetical protein